MVNTQIQAKEGKQKKLPTVQVSIEIESPVKQSFEYIVPVDLPHIFKRYKNLPAIDSTNAKEIWYTPGMQRTIFFEDGNSAHEYLLTVNPHHDFSYRIDSFTSPLKRLAKQINGKWVFSETKDGKTKIVWTYEIEHKNFLARMMINILVRNNMRSLLNNALLILKEDLEKHG